MKSLSSTAKGDCTMAMKPRAMKNGKTKKMMRGGMADKPMAMKNGGKAGAKKMMRGGMAKKK